MVKIIIDSELCCGSGRCIDVCPEKAINFIDGKAVLDESKCDFDGICIPACPNQAISFDEDYSEVGCGF